MEPSVNEQHQGAGSEAAATLRSMKEQAAKMMVELMRFFKASDTQADALRAVTH